MAHEIRNPDLWESGARKIAWVKRNMPLLNGIEKEFEQEKPFAGLRVALSVHLEAKTAYLCKVLAAGGAEMYVTGSNPLSTQDDVAAALVHDGLNVFAWYDASTRGVPPPHFAGHQGSPQRNNRRRRRPGKPHSQRVPRAYPGGAGRLRGDHHRNYPPEGHG